MQTELAGKVVRNCSLWIWTGASVAIAFPQERAAALVGTAVYVIGLAASFRLPEPTREQLPD